MASSGEADKILSQLTLEEKVKIVGAADWWRTEPIRRGDSILLPHIKVCRPRQSEMRAMKSF